MTVNLIPQKLKKEKIVERWLYRFYLLLASVIAIFSISAVIMYAANSFYYKEQSKLTEKINETEIQMKKFKELSEKIRQTNIKMESLEKIDSEKIIWSEIIEEIAQSTPASAKIQSLSLNKEAKNLSLSGIAETRTEIALMKETMETSAFFKNVTFSSSTYEPQVASYNFTLNAEIEVIK